MSDHNHPPLFENRIAPPYLKSVMVLVLFLSSIVFTPLSVMSSSENQNNMFSLTSYPSFQISESLPLYQEKMEMVVGKEESLITKLEIEGGIIETPFDLSLPVFASVSQIDFLISNQSNFVNVWTNPLWQSPDGLVIRIKTRTINQDILESISTYVQTLIFQFYGVNLSVFNLKEVSPTENQISLIASATNINALSVFHEIFAPYEEDGNGNMVEIISNMFQLQPIVYAFGYSIHKQRVGVSKISRSAVIALEDKIELSGNLRTFNVSSIVGSKIIPNPSAFVSKFSFRLPFYANITKVNPDTDNVASAMTGFFEWILKYSNFTKHAVFDAEVIYSPSSSFSMDFPRVIVTNSYSDQLLEEDGILNMTYSIQNVGSSPAYDTTIRFPIPAQLETFIIAGTEIPVLRDDLQIDELFSTFIELEIDYFSETINIPILDITGWYSNTTSLSLARWMDNTSIELHEYVNIHCSNGVSSDLYLAVESRIQPILETYGILYIIANYKTLIRDELSQAVAEAYAIILSEFYENQTLFQYNSTDFAYVPTIYGSYLECIIPSLDVNETLEKSWRITDIPTSDDKFGAFSISTKQSVDNEYAVFKTTESDYKQLMLALFTETNTAGRFLSVYESEIDSFVSLGSRFLYSDISGKDYYGLTNGLNFQIGDDEAVLQSTLYSEQSTYEVGDLVSFTLNISNYGTLDAYDIHVDIVNIKLNYLWLPTDIIIVKSFDIDQIIIGENLTQSFSVTANSYIGLNTYVALISFISDKDQAPVDVENPWTGISKQWIFGGETTNIISSTLTFGILLPPVALQNQTRPSFPLPEITVDSSYQLSNDNTTLIVEYEITNDGLSPTSVSVYQFVDLFLYTLDNASCDLVHNSDITILTPISSEQLALTRISFANTTLNPGDKLIITEVFSDLPEEFTIPPIIISYSSDYEILETDFQSLDPQTQDQPPENEILNIKLAPANITEGTQNLFLWSSFTPLFTINIQISEEFERIELSSLPWLYLVISTAVVSGAIVIIMLSSRFRG